MRLLIFSVITSTLILVTSCASRQIMKDCRSLRGGFYDCEKP
jgi:hypothetical protein